LVLRFLPDPNTLVANILSESVDVILQSSADADIGLAADVEQRWQGTGHEVVYRNGGGVERLEIQLRPEFARPQNGLPNRTRRHSPSGERFAITMHGPAGTATEKKLNVLADTWKAVGMEISFNLIPSTQYNDLDYRSHLPGSGLSSVSADGFSGGRNYIHSKT